ncbi:hypothetical protein J2855_003665 [Agrobacterium tumefaciens]|uniref:AbiTii domain-containing protein n=1 Tax=Agrobacterium tumefaciens TaxID=358 RepID=UPI0013A6A738|nr:hypothetical protein [Agrobacterium tumefaciens]MBP2510017.1 hypothetical protein [Agrobacterium tumefaciens]MBP2519463.1 hypothetical protein [Agrobacterium tumefaciens]MBP2578210.1 hypothetical protein [Agrobacterium tumefaciens]MBP2596156.1 hypothetical protein [Agrobacterium tumefaciens]
MGLLTEIQNDALNDSTPIATVLRKMLVLASHLDSDVLEGWVRYELDGYPKAVDLPQYRLINMNFLASATNGYYKVDNTPVGSLVVRSATKIDDADVFKFRDAIGTIEPDILKTRDLLYVNMMNYAPALHGKIFEVDYQIIDFKGVLSPSKVMGVLEAVRNRVLEFVLALRKKYPIADEVDGLNKPNPEMTQAVTKIYYNTIHGNVGVVGEAKDSTVNIVINQGNISDLRQQLIQYNVKEDDIAELEIALSAEPLINADKRFGPKVGAWLGNMVTKAASGAWDVSVSTASALLTGALSKYYGLG